MAYQNPKQYGWCPPNDYQVHEVAEPALRRRSDRPRHHKGRVAFKTDDEEPKTTVVETPSVPETKATTNATKSVDEIAGLFINNERRRIELARLKSLSAKGLSAWDSENFLDGYGTRKSYYFV